MRHHPLIPLSMNALCKSSGDLVRHLVWSHRAGCAAEAAFNHVQNRSQTGSPQKHMQHTNKKHLHLSLELSQKTRNGSHIKPL